MVCCQGSVCCRDLAQISWQVIVLHKTSQSQPSAILLTSQQFPQYPQNVNSYDPIGRSRCYLLSKHDHCHSQTLRFISTNTFQPSTTARPALRLNTTACATLRARRLPSEARVSTVHTRPTSPAMVLSPMNSRKKESAMPRKWTSTTSRLQTTFLGRTMQRAEWTRILLICTASLLKRPRRFWSSGFGMHSRLGKRIYMCKALWLFGSLALFA